VLPQQTESFRQNETQSHDPPSFRVYVLDGSDCGRSAIGVSRMNEEPEVGFRTAISQT
jgi:hypothetical protein